MNLNLVLIDPIKTAHVLILDELKKIPIIKIKGCYVNYNKAYVSVFKEIPDIAIIGFSGDLNTLIDFIEKLSSLSNVVKIILLIDKEETFVRNHLINRGIDGCVFRGMNSKILEKSILSICDPNYFIELN